MLFGILHDLVLYGMHVCNIQHTGEYEIRWYEQNVLINIIYKNEKCLYGNFIGKIL